MRPQEGFETSYGIGIRNYAEKRAGDVELFANTEGVLLMYDGTDQEMLRSFTGLRYKIGAVELGTAYERQYVWGESPMHWDTYKERERIHQKIRFPLGREVYTSFRGSYDLDESMIDEMNYSLQWITDCMLWDLHYKDDRTSGSDDEIGLSLFIRAFPDREASFGQSLNKDPFDRPREIPKDKK